LRKEKEFTESFMKENSGNFNYLHIATHGIFNQYNPLYSYILANKTEKDDGKIYVDEVFGLNLSCKLVVLSACETGLGSLSEGDDLTGLSRAFIYAGAEGIIVSLWKVDDNSTAWLMKRLYYYIDKGYHIGEALAKAQNDLITLGTGGEIKDFSEPDNRLLFNPEDKKRGHLLNPYYWAPFIYVGI